MLSKPFTQDGLSAPITGEHSPSPQTAIIETHFVFWGMTSFWSLPYIHVVKHFLHCSLLKCEVSPQFNLSPVMRCEEIWDASLTLEII